MDGDKATRCPWGRGKVPLKGKALSESERLYLAQCVSRGGSSRGFTAKKYSLTKSVTGKYAQSARSGVALHSTAGKPPTLDSVSTEALVDFLSSDV